MNPLVYTLVVMLAALTGGLVAHFLAHSRTVAEAKKHADAAVQIFVDRVEQKGLHRICQECGLLVARFKLLEDGTIHCVNCLRAAEREAIYSQKR